MRIISIVVTVVYAVGVLATICVGACDWGKDDPRFAGDKLGYRS